MSFAVYLETGDVTHAEENYTSNMGAFFAWALDGTETAEPTRRCDSRDALFGARPTDGLVTLDGMQAFVAARRIRRALERIERAPPSSLDRFNAQNGWGHWGGATLFLRRVLWACGEYPSATVSATVSVSL